MTASGSTLQPNDGPGRAFCVAELGHGAVWIQYRSHEGRQAQSLSQAERAARSYGLPTEKLGADFAEMLEAEVDRSELAVRVQTVDDAAKKLFETCVDDYEYTQSAGRHP